MFRFADRVLHWKSILLKPLVLVVGSIYAVIASLTWIRDEMVRPDPGKTAWHVIDFLPRWSVWEWLCGALAIAVASALEYSYRHVNSLKVGHRTHVRELEEEINALKTRLVEGPTVILSNAGTGVELRIESVRQDALNVRLVTVESNNYRLNSDVVRTLREGAQEALLLHCHAKERSGNQVREAYAAPTLFFNDLLPTYEGEDIVGALEHTMTILTERQLVALIELAYSNLSGTQHYRSSFKIRWNTLRDSIVDVEPVMTRPDDDPPPTTPPNVIPEQLRQLSFGQWHAGTAQGFPIQYGQGHPNWISVVNRQAAPARAATNVAARLEFTDSTGAVRFTVPHAEWYVKPPFGDSREVHTWRTVTTIDGGDEQSFVLFATSNRGRLVVYKDSTEPLGDLSYDAWRVRIIVASDDAEGFEGELRFSFTKNGLIPNDPPFTVTRSISPLLSRLRRDG